MSALYNVHRDPKRRPQPFTPYDLMGEKPPDSGLTLDEKASESARRLVALGKRMKQQNRG